MTEHTPKQIALARRIGADAVTRREKWLPGVKAGIYEEIIAGKHDSEAIVQAPLAAIVEVSELAAKYVDINNVTTPTVRGLRNGDHLP